MNSLPNLLYDSSDMNTSQQGSSLSFLCSTVVYTNMKYACFHRWQSHHAAKLGWILPEAPFEIRLHHQREREGMRDWGGGGERIMCMPLISLKEIWANITLHGWKKNHIVWHSTHYARQSVLRLWKYLRGMCPGQCECALFRGRCFLGNKDYVSKPGNACLRAGTTHNNKTEA